MCDLQSRDDSASGFLTVEGVRVKRKLILAGLAAGAIAVSGLAAGTTGASAMPAQGRVTTHVVRACAPVTKVGQVACDALVLTDADGQMIRGASPLVGSFTPADFQKAYNIEGLKSHGATVAIVDAYGYSTLEADLKVYRSTYDLPPCTVANGCLTILDERGGHDYPPDNAGWDLEQALDVDMVSAACPDCKILVVQGKAPNLKSLGHAVDTAAKTKGVVAISNSYGGGNSQNNPYYNHPGVAVVASTGDSGYQGGQYPASDTHVIAVGGTSLFKDASKRGFHESAWSGAGSGCARRNPAPNYQRLADTSCKTDAIADVSAAADPANGGASIYYAGRFQSVGGTSEASPLIGGVFGLSGNTAGYPGKYLYRDPKDLYDVTTGSNGSCGPPLCTSGKGWDGPTGLGTPNGIGAF
jgi:subtilase family serine protease